MKTLITLLALAASAFAAGDVPSMPFDKALAIVQHYIKESGRGGEIVIGGLTSEREAIGSKSGHWFAKWATPLSIDGGRKELGIEIAMDGTIARIVDKKSRK